MGNRIDTFQEAGNKVVSVAKMKKFDVAGELFKRGVEASSSVETQNDERAA